jgi:hypothetical protein
VFFCRIGSGREDSSLRHVFGRWIGRCSGWLASWVSMVGTRGFDACSTKRTWRGSGLVFPTETGEPRDRWTVRRVFRGVLRQAGSAAGRGGHDQLAERALSASVGSRSTANADTTFTLMTSELVVALLAERPLCSAV